MKTYKNPASLFLVQVDHLSGEFLGAARKQLAAKGVINVQMLPSLTKKARPGHLLLIDAPQEKNEEVEAYLVKDLGVSGWHRIPTEHVHVGTQIIEKKLIFHTDTADVEINVFGKKIKEVQVHIRPEHESCVQVQKKLHQEFNFTIPLRELEKKIAEALNSQGAEFVIDLSHEANSKTAAE